MRVLWYLVELIAREPGYDGRGFILLCWVKDATIFDIDQKINSMLKHFSCNAWPTKAMPSHACCCPEIILRIVKPILRGLIGKEMRSRLIFHDVPESEIVESVAAYGITKDVLPVEMGGTFRFNLSEWISNRRAVEMEEI